MVCYYQKGEKREREKERFFKEETVMLGFFSAATDNETPTSPRNPYIDDDQTYGENESEEEDHIQSISTRNYRRDAVDIGNGSHSLTGNNNQNSNFLDLMNGNHNSSPSLSGTQAVGYSFRDNFHTVTEGESREREDMNKHNLKEDNDTKEMRQEKLEDANWSRDATDPDNSLLSFLSILSAQLNIPFNGMKTNAGLPTPEIQGMLEIARSYLKQWSKLRKINLNHIIYDDGEDGDLRVKFAELISHVMHKQSGGSAYGKRINSNGGTVFYTSANHRAKNANFRILIAFKRYFKNMHWIRNPRIRRLKQEKIEFEKRKKITSVKDFENGIAEIDWKIDELSRIMPKVLSIT